MSKTALNQIAPADLVPTFGVDGFRYHFLRDQAFGPDGDFSYEGMVARYNADLANNLGNLLARVSTVVERKCGGIGPAPDPTSPLASIAAVRVRRSGIRLGPHRPERGPRGHVAPGSRNQRCPGGRRTLEGGAGSGRRRGARRRAGGAAHRGGAGQPGPDSRRLGRSGAASAWPESHRSSACPRRPCGAAIPEGCRSSGPVPSSPGSRSSGGVWADSHCHLDYEGVGSSAIAGAREAGVTRIITIGTDAAASVDRRGHCRGARGGVGHGRVCTPTRRRTDSGVSRPCSTRRTRWWSAWGSAGSTISTSTPRAAPNDRFSRPR